MGRRRKEQRVPRVFPVVQLTIESLDMEGRGIAHHDGKVVFVEGALPFEEVRADVIREKSNYNQARTTEVLTASSERVEPKCAAFGMCGGCAMQHINPRAQIAAKQRVLEDNLQRIGQVKPEVILRPIAGPTWGYRYRARLSVRNVHKKGEVLVGFREKNGSYVANMTACEVLPKHISDLLPKLREPVSALNCWRCCSSWLFIVLSWLAISAISLMKLAAVCALPTISTTEIPLAPAGATAPNIKLPETIAASRRRVNCLETFILLLLAWK